MSTRAPIFGYLVVALGCAAAIAALSLSSVVQGVLIGLLGACMFELIQPAASEWPYIKLAVDARLRGRRRALIRLSISYLYRIKIGNDYLLIRGSRIPDQYQPIGGVFKRFPEATETLVGLSVLDDDAMPIDTSSEQDLRIRVPATHLMAFLRWYESGKQREVETWREFYEEMVRPGLVSPELFPHLLTRHLRQHRTPIRWSEHFQCWELLLAEIVEPILTPAQRAALEDTKAMQDAQLLWVGDPLIRSTGYDKTRHERVAKISETSCWIL